ncbi:MULTISPECIES: helix-turn-helix domain-containing protein [Pseudoalteromonas]|uniref:Transcriptional regulator n=1 Tax=Pseudoalteromonas amylolytica TaxID=1859457 RepID=A0A1S1MYL1_9GAMM|nr:MULTISPECIES: helix-turn-helix transcriptional regulator [Pseudoalteromonas]OHU89217.1 transcriptional regulator [Pseudoalteromonas sp. JW3]OHU92117.1 transcriptional regulator [Pseudoalteromonas amylolytica]
MINGDDLSAMRLNAGISQKEMAKKLGVDRKTISNYELGVIQIRVGELFSWFYYCKIDTSTVLSQVRVVREKMDSNKTTQSGTERGKE